MDAAQISQLKYNSVYCTHFLPHPEGTSHRGSIEIVQNQSLLKSAQAKEYISSSFPQRAAQELLFFNFAPDFRCSVIC